jgi:hypothetical protein
MNYKYLKKFNESIIDYSSFKKIVSDLTEDLTTISDKREIEIFEYVGSRHTKPHIDIHIQIDDVIDTNGFLLLDSLTRKELTKRNDVIISLLDQIEEGVDRCQINYNRIEFAVKNHSYDNDGDEYPIPQTLVIKIIGIETE